MPIGSATIQVKTSEQPASTTVITRRSAMISLTGRWCCIENEVPRLPCSNWVIHLRYCTGNGRLSPQISRRCSASLRLTLAAERLQLADVAVHEVAFRQLDDEEGEHRDHHDGHHRHQQAADDVAGHRSLTARESAGAGAPRPGAKRSIATCPWAMPSTTTPGERSRDSGICRPRTSFRPRWPTGC